MALTKEIVIDKMEIVGDYNIIQIRESTEVYVNSELLTKTYHRHCVTPINDISNESAEIKAICAELYTQEIKDSYQLFLDNQGV